MDNCLWLYSSRWLEMEAKEEQLNNSTAITITAHARYRKETGDHLQEEHSVLLPANKGTANSEVSNQSA